MKRKTAKKRTARPRSAGKARAARKPAKKSTKKVTRGRKRPASGRGTAGKSRTRRAPTTPKGRKRSKTAAKPKRAAKSGKKTVKGRSQPRPPLIRKGLPVTKAALRRLGKMQQADRPEIKSIIVYTTDQKPKNLYPRKIISPPFPSKCCTDANRVRVGKIYEELGRHYYYKVCKACGHAVKYYFNKETEFDSPRLRKYYEWKKSVFH